ncbi:hypothetical protein [Roseimaritima ulvae]|nr:hypothetical protein [Roseimaritima ulvae]
MDEYIPEFVAAAAWCGRHRPCTNCDATFVSQFDRGQCENCGTVFEASAIYGMPEDASVEAILAITQEESDAILKLDLEEIDSIADNGWKLRGEQRLEYNYLLKRMADALADGAKLYSWVTRTSNSREGWVFAIKDNSVVEKMMVDLMISNPG